MATVTDFAEQIGGQWQLRSAKEMYIALAAHLCTGDGEGVGEEGDALCSFRADYGHIIYQDQVDGGHCVYLSEDEKRLVVVCDYYGPWAVYLADETKEA